METENPNFSPGTGIGSWRVGISVLLVLKRNTVPVPDTHNGAPVTRLVPLLDMEMELPNSEQSVDLFGILTNNVPVELNRNTAPPKTVTPRGPMERA